MDEVRLNIQIPNFYMFGVRILMGAKISHGIFMDPELLVITRMSYHHTYTKWMYKIRIVLRFSIE